MNSDQSPLRIDACRSRSRRDGIFGKRDNNNQPTVA